MNKSINEPEANNNTVCEALGCYSEAINKVAASVGHNRTIFVFLCDRCAQKFCEGE